MHSANESKKNEKEKKIEEIEEKELEFKILDEKISNIDDLIEIGSNYENVIDKSGHEVADIVVEARRADFFVEYYPPVK